MPTRERAMPPQNQHTLHNLDFQAGARASPTNTAPTKSGIPAAGRDHECDHDVVCVTYETRPYSMSRPTDPSTECTFVSMSHPLPSPPHQAASVPGCRVRGVEKGETSSQPYEHLGAAFLSNTLSMFLTAVGTASPGDADMAPILV